MNLLEARWLRYLPRLLSTWSRLLTSLTVALGGLLVGWLVYRNIQTAKEDFLQIPVLKNKWYIDEIYNFVFVKPSYWFAETFVYKWMDKGLIDGTLHLVGRATADHRFYDP